MPEKPSKDNTMPPIVTTTAANPDKQNISSIMIRTKNTIKMRFH